MRASYHLSLKCAHTKPSEIEQRNTSMLVVYFLSQRQAEGAVGYVEPKLVFPNTGFAIPSIRDGILICITIT